MPFIFRILKAAQGLGAGPNNALYTVGAAPTTSAIISNVRFYNTAAGTVTATLIIRPSAGAVNPSNFAKVVVPGTSVAVYNTEVTLGQGVVLEASMSASMDVNVFGVERTQ